MTGPVVPDASVVLKWVLPEADSDLALSLREHTLLAPDLLLVECGNALWAQVRRGFLAEAEALAGLDLLAAAPVLAIPSRELLPLALRLALDLGHPVYDCLYLSLALSQDATVVTADRKFHDLAQANPEVRDRIALLAELA